MRRVVLASLAILAVLAAGALGDDGGVTSRSRQRWNVGGNSVIYGARDVNGNQRDEVEYRVTTTNRGVKTDYRYLSRSDVSSGKASDAVALRMRMSVLRIVEFDPTTASGDTPTVANVKSNLILSPWGSFTEIPSAFSGKVVGVSVTTSDNVFKLTARFSDDITNRTLNLDANHAKYDFTISGYSFAQAGTKLAIAMRTATSSKTAQRTVTGNGYQVDVTNDLAKGAAAYWSWKPTVTASDSNGNNPVTVNVKAVAFAPLTSGDSDFDGGDGDSQYLVWAVLDTTTHYQKYVWDPEVGVTYSGAFSLARVSVTCIVAALALAGLSKWM